MSLTQTSLALSILRAMNVYEQVGFLHTLWDGQKCSNVFGYIEWIGNLIGENGSNLSDHPMRLEIAEKKARKAILETGLFSYMGAQTVPSYTVSGRRIFLDDPKHTEILLSDILWSLSRAVRYNGALDVTVLQHSTLCVAIAKHMITDLQVERPRVYQYVAIHDFHEAYIQDVSRGFKQALPSYQRFEAAWEQHIHESLGFTWPRPAAFDEFINLVDIFAVIVEADLLRHPQREEMMEKLGVLKHDAGYQLRGNVLPMDAVTSKEFLDILLNKNTSIEMYEIVKSINK